MFVTFEGPDGCGKTTQAKLAVQWFEKKFGKENVVFTREPGGWPEEGEKIRDILLHGKISHDMTELFLFMADRCEHAKQLIQPSLSEKKVVISDRYIHSTLAYQCWGREIDMGLVKGLFDISKLPKPDLTIFYTILPEVATDRILQRKGSTPDRLESEKRDFFERVHRGYKYLSKGNDFSKQTTCIDGSGSLDLVHKKTINALNKFLKQYRPSAFLNEEKEKETLSKGAVNPLISDMEI